MSTDIDADDLHDHVDPAVTGVTGQDDMFQVPVLPGDDLAQLDCPWSTEVILCPPTNDGERNKDQWISAAPEDVIEVGIETDTPVDLEAMR